MDSIAEIEGHLASAKVELTNFNCKKTAAAATRSRAHLLKAKKLCDTARKAILAECKSAKSAKSSVVEEPIEEPIEVPIVKKTRKPRAKKV